jgi:hypothetical protein
MTPIDTALLAIAAVSLIALIGTLAISIREAAARKRMLGEAKKAVESSAMLSEAVEQSVSKLESRRQK